MLNVSIVGKALLKNKGNSVLESYVTVFLKTSSVCKGISSDNIYRFRNCCIKCRYTSAICIGMRHQEPKNCSSQFDVNSTTHSTPGYIYGT